MKLYFSLIRFYLKSSYDTIGRFPYHSVIIQTFIWLGSPYPLHSESFIPLIWKHPLELEFKSNFKGGYFKLFN